MNKLASVVVFITKFNRIIGNMFIWLSLATVLICFIVVIQRYLFSVTQIWMQDLYVWCNGVMFTAVAGFTFSRDEHVRVDVYYGPASLESKAWRDLLGVLLFLLPFCAVVWAYGLSFVLRSWHLREASTNLGGLPALFILKSFILVFVVLVALQGIAMALRSILVLRGMQDLLPYFCRYDKN